MARLSSIAYDSLTAIPKEVESLGLNVVWGPVELCDDLGVSYSLAYVAKRSNPEEYTVVIRGTNFLSLESWAMEDFDVEPPLQAFSQLAPHAPASALVSQGTFDGMNDLLSLTDPITGQGIVDFLKASSPQYLYVTGHSLGGTLTPPMFAYLNDVLYGGGFVHNMAYWSFAALTSGDQGFADYFNTLGNPAFVGRLHNTLDIAPYCWWSLDNVQNVYKANGLSWGPPESDAIEDLFSEVSGAGYAHPSGDQALAGVFNGSFPTRDIWVMQAMYQHHSTTYISLVDAQYPA